MTERLFFALWPDETVRERLANEVVPQLPSSGCRMQRPDQWHVTLVFLGQVGTEQVPAALQSASAIRSGPVAVEFDAIEHWRRPGVLCLTASVVPVPLDALVTGLRTALIRNGFELEERKFRPHVTLARKVASWRGPLRLAEPLVWTAQRFALVRSVSDAAGSRYEPCHWWNPGIEEAR